MKLALAIPTRGVIFAQTIESTILSTEFPQDAYVTIVSGLPIPDAHNECIRRALATDCTHILFVEEDMVIPDGGLALMMKLAEEKPIVAIDYPITKDLRTTSFIDEKIVLWTGFGCTMFNRDVFEKNLHDPWLTDEYDVMIDKMHPFEYHTVKGHGNNRYGKYDILFGLEMKKLGIPMYVIPDISCRHLRMKSWERKTVNEGTHEIYDL